MSALRAAGWLLASISLASCAGTEPGGAGAGESPPFPSASGAAVGEPAADVTVIPAAGPTELIVVEAGEHRPLYPGKDEPEQVAVAPFGLERHPVTNAQFLAFVHERPEWRRSRVRRLFADEGYLSHWDGDLSFAEHHRHAPVTRVSWFAARAYAARQGRRLPTLAEWEYVAAASETSAAGREEPGHRERILSWYARPTPKVLPEVAGTPANHHGIQDMHGLIWEWVEDYNTALVTGESRGDSGLDRGLFCGSGSIGSADPSDYAAFMRFAFRSSLEAAYTVDNLGFRCASDVQQESPP